MENIILVIQNNWQSILEYALMGLMYFLVFLYNNKVGNTRSFLLTHIKEKTLQMDEKHTSASKELAEAKAKYEEAVAEIATLKQP